MGVDGRRVAEVVAEFADGSHQRGSGFWLRADVLVTAWHVVAGAVGVRVVFEAGSHRRRTTCMRSVLRLGSSDVAVACLDGLAADAAAVPVGGFGEQAAVTGAQVFGFPRFKVRNVDGSDPLPDDGKAKFRELAQLLVRLAPQGNWRTGRCELAVTPPAAGADPKVSPWEGLSGGPVFDQQSGALVGVVTDHHRPEGLSRLAAARLDLCLAQLTATEAAQVLPLLGLESVDRLVAAGVPPWVGWKRLALADQLTEIVPADGLRDRDRELAQLTAFCAGAESYGYWQAPPWAGKTALMATFALHPPAGVTVVSYFVTARQAGENDSTGFLRAVSAQLAALSGQEVPNLLTTREVYRAFLADRARHADAAGQLLVLLVDGLDEDSGTHAGSGLPSIASLLPKKPPPGLKVMVAGRPDPTLPADLAADHPLRSCRPWQLSVSPHATDIERVSRAELMELLAWAGLHRDVVGLIAASGGGLTLADLEHLAQQPQYVVADLLGSVFGRTVHGRLAPSANDPQHVYLFAHDKLREQAVDVLGKAELARYRQQIHIWADRYRHQCWPAGTPRYLLVGYQQMLQATGDIPRLARLAEDADRHDRMLDHTGGDNTAYAEIQTALDRLTADHDLDIRTIVRIARHREFLQQRNYHIPVELPSVWALLGKMPRGEALARSIPNSDNQVRALQELVRVVAAVDADRAEQIAYSITYPVDQALALVELVRVVAAVDADRAEQIARSASHPYAEAKALVELVRVVAAVDADRAEQIAYSITYPVDQALALVELVRVVAAVDADRAEQIARSASHPYAEAKALAELVPVIGAVDVDRAEQIAHRITIRDDQVRALAGLVPVIAAADADRARQVADQAVQIAHGITDPHTQAHALAGLAREVAAVDADQAVQIAHRISPPYAQESLAKLVPVIAAADVDQAEQIAHSITDWYHRAWALAELAWVVAAADVGRAEQIAHCITEPRNQAQALVKLVPVIGAVDVDRAEQIAHCITEPRNQAQALAELARVVAAVDADRALRVADQAEEIAHNMTIPFDRARVLVELVAVVDADRARRFADQVTQIAHSVTNSFDTRALAELVPVVAAADVGLAEQIAHSITKSDDRVLALSGLVAAVAVVDADRAEQIAHNTTSAYDRARVLAELARVVAAADADRALRVAARAEQIARSIVSPVIQVETLAKLVPMVAAVDADRARRIADQASQIAYGIIEPYKRARALLRLVRAVAALDVDQAIQIARSITEPSNRALILAELVPVVAAVDVDRAEQIAHSITEPSDQAQALAELARVVVAADVDRARRVADQAAQVAHSITEPSNQAQALADLVPVVAAVDVGRAEQIAHSITEPNNQTRALAKLVPVVAAFDVDRAEQIADQAAQIAYSITEPDDQVQALGELVAVVAAFDADRARQVADQAAQIAYSITEPNSQVQALFKLVAVVAEVDADRAEQIAHRITDTEYRAWALGELVAVVAVVDADRAEQIAHRITQPGVQARALVQVALRAAEATSRPGRRGRLISEAIRLGGSWTDGLEALTIELQTAICDDVLHRGSKANGRPAGIDSTARVDDD